MPNFIKDLQLILSACFLVLLVNSCVDHGCPPSQTTETPINGYSLSKTPYTGYDTLFFTNLNGDTCIVIGNGRQFYSRMEQVFVNEPGCEQDYEKIECCKIQFASIKGNLNFTIDLQDARTLKITVNDYLYYFRFLPSDIDLDLSKYDSSYRDSIELNGKFYFSVLGASVYRELTNESDPDNYYGLDYNKEFGILRIRNNAINDE